MHEQVDAYNYDGGRRYTVIKLRDGRRIDAHFWISRSSRTPTFRNSTLIDLPDLRSRTPTPISFGISALIVACHTPEKMREGDLQEGSALCCVQPAVRTVNL